MKIIYKTKLDFQVSFENIILGISFHSPNIKRNPLRTLTFTQMEAMINPAKEKNAPKGEVIYMEYITSMNL